MINLLPRLRNISAFVAVVWACSFLAFDVNAESVDVFANPISVKPGVWFEATEGALVFRGGFELRSRDPRFGGLSGLTISGDGVELVAISDRGWWFKALLVYGTDGDLISLNSAELSPVLHLNGRQNEDKAWLDAEALVRLPGGDFIVAFERMHRLWRYSNVDAIARSLRINSIFTNLPYNRGIEALITLDGGRLLAIAESGPSFHILSGWIFDGVQAESLSYPYDGYFRPSDAVRLDKCRILILERGYNERRGVAARLMLLDVVSVIASADLQPRLFIELVPPVPLDNFEGLAVRRDPLGKLFVYLVSDDNYSSSQRTLLLMFEFLEVD